MTAVPLHDEFPDDLPSVDARRSFVAGDALLPSVPAPLRTPNPPTPRMAEALLAIACDSLDDLEKVRIATENRVRSLGQAKGMGESGEAARLTSLAEAIAALEHGAELEIKRALRAHPLGPWVKATIGVGEKQGGRLIAAIGDPYIRHYDDSVRTVSALWAYCGYHVLRSGQVLHDAPNEGAGADLLDPGQNPPDTQKFGAGVEPSAGSRSDRAAHHHLAAGSEPLGGDAQDQPDDQRIAGVAAKRRKGQKANWNGTAKMRAFLVAEACVKAGVRKDTWCDDTAGYDVAGRHGISAYGQTYLDRRAHTARTHPEWTDGHSHNDGLRIVAKAVLRDLWRESKRIHEAAA